MRRLAEFFARLAVAAVVLVPAVAEAQMRPHRAEYSLRLGTALNATRIGTVVQDIGRDCDGWRIRRDVSVEMALTPSLEFGIVSRMEGEEKLGGDFTWRAVQAVNGVGSEMRGTVRRKNMAYHAEMTTPEGTEQSILPPLTLMPVAAIDHLIGRLEAGDESFPVLVFGGEAAGATFLVDVKKSAAGSGLATPPSLQPVEVPGTQSWPVTMAIARADQEDSKPLLSLRARIFDSGILDRLVVDTSFVTVAAHLRALQMHEPPNCPGSRD